jgi:hypothetical protein
VENCSLGSVILTETDDILKACLFFSCVKNGLVIDWLHDFTVIKSVFNIPGLLLSLHIYAVRIIILHDIYILTGPYLRTGQRGLGPGRQISRGGILKKSRLKYGIRGKKKGSPRERNLREFYTQNTMFCLLSVFCVLFLLTHTWIQTNKGGGHKIFLGPGA